MCDGHHQPGESCSRSHCPFPDSNMWICEFWVWRILGPLSCPSPAWSTGNVSVPGCCCSLLPLCSLAWHAVSRKCWQPQLESVFHTRVLMWVTDQQHLTRANKDLTMVLVQSTSLLGKETSKKGQTPMHWDIYSVRGWVVVWRLFFSMFFHYYFLHAFCLRPIY